MIAGFDRGGDMKVLDGASHKVLSFIATEWRRLLHVCLWPLAALAALIGGEIAAFALLWRDIVQRIMVGDVGPPIVTQILQLQGLMFVAQILGALAASWMFVRTVRLYLGGESQTPARSKPILKSTLMSAIYGLGIWLISIAATLGTMIAVAIAGMIVAALTGAFSDAPHPSSIGLLIAIISLGYVGALTLMMWIFCRFAIGLPAVALGRTPDFFRDMWPLSRGESWGVPWRLGIAWLVFALALAPIAGVAAFRFYSQLFSLDPATARQIPFTVMNDVIWLAPVACALAIPLLWFSSLLLAEAYDRFEKRRSPVMR
jgi:hypothetical protein